MTTFVLVHGACHDAWCWSEVSAELQRLGHRALAVELACDRPELGLADDVAVVHDAMDRAGAEPVLVGHSLGALAATAAAVGRPVGGLVFVAGVIPMPGLSMADRAEADADRDCPTDDGDLEFLPDSMFVFSETGAARLLYPDCAPAVAKEATGRLRPQRSMWRAVCPGDGFPATRIRSIVCAEDRVVNPPWSRKVAQERLGIEPEELPGGHSPMVSRPVELAALLGA
jgi:pimeloyl-ACP methyl ester carboxylesterase